MQQSREYQFSQLLHSCAERAHIICKFAQSKLDVFFSRAILAAENKPSYKFDNRSLYQKTRIGELPHFCNEMKKCSQ